MVTGVRRAPNRSLTNPITGPVWRFFISSWICEVSILVISEGAKDGAGFLPHCFQSSSSSSSNTSSNSSVMWTLRLPARAKWEFSEIRRRKKRKRVVRFMVKCRVQRRMKQMEERKKCWYLIMCSLHEIMALVVCLCMNYVSWISNTLCNCFFRKIGYLIKFIIVITFMRKIKKLSFLVLSVTWKYF